MGFSQVQRISFDAAFKSVVAVFSNRIVYLYLS